MKTSSEIGLADLLRALDRLQPDRETLQLVARCLGYTPGDPNPSEATRGVSQEREEGSDQRLASDSLTSRAAAESSAQEATMPPPPRHLLKTSMRRLEPSPAEQTLSAPPPEIRNAPQVESPGAAVPRISLFHTRTAPHLLSAALSTRRPGPELDMEATLQTLLSGRPLRRVPRKPIPTLERGVQLLLDYSDAMAPFRMDLADLRRQLEEVVGREQCETFRFDVDPRRAATGPWPDSPVWQPRRGRPVAVATDFGLSMPQRTSGNRLLQLWDEFVAICSEADCPVIVFNPLGRNYWPRNLSRRITLIHWNTTTRAVAIRQQVGPGHPLRETRDSPAPAYLTEALRLRPRLQDAPLEIHWPDIQQEAED